MVYDVKDKECEWGPIQVNVVFRSPVRVTQSCKLHHV